MWKVKERPILFSGEMVRAILDGRKTQTRRLVKPQPILQGETWFLEQGLSRSAIAGIDGRCHAGAGTHCQFGLPGDHLWVREGFCRSTDDEITYRASIDESQYPKDINWKPSIHMPRWACRLVLEITEVRVERLQNISRQDAIAEGISVLPLQSADDPSAWWQSSPGVNQERTPQATFAGLWRSIHGKESWDANPWLWVISFKPVRCGRCPMLLRARDEEAVTAVGSTPRGRCCA